jgi:hypothetical protein
MAACEAGKADAVDVFLDEYAENSEAWAWTEGASTLYRILDSFVHFKFAPKSDGILLSPLFFLRSRTLSFMSTPDPPSRFSPSRFSLSVYLFSFSSFSSPHPNLHVSPSGAFFFKEFASGETTSTRVATVKTRPFGIRFDGELTVVQVTQGSPAAKQVSACFLFFFLSLYSRPRGAFKPLLSQPLARTVLSLGRPRGRQTAHGGRCAAAHSLRNRRAHLPYRLLQNTTNRRR